MALVAFAGLTAGLGGCQGEVTADFTMSPNPALTGQTVTFDGSASSSERGENCYDGGTIVSWEWDLDGNGTFETSGQVVRRSYSRAGVYDVTLRVTDNSCGSDQVTKQLVVVGAGSRRRGERSAPGGATARAPVAVRAPAVLVPAEGLRPGTTLSVAPGKWTGAAAILHRWQACGDGGCRELATGERYTLTDADAGQRIRVVAEARNRVGTALRASALTDVVAAPSAPESGGAGDQPSAPEPPVCPDLDPLPVDVPGCR
jgi:PKD repeat protein